MGPEVAFSTTSNPAADSAVGLVPVVVGRAGAVGKEAERGVGRATAPRVCAQASRTASVARAVVFIKAAGCRLKVQGYPCKRHLVPVDRRGRPRRSRSSS